MDAALPFIGSVSTALFLVVVGWEIIWKGIAMWKCGRNNQLWWFIPILILSTAGILPIVYLLFFQKKKKH